MCVCYGSELPGDVEDRFDPYIFRLKRAVGREVMCRSATPIRWSQLTRAREILKDGDDYNFTAAKCM